MKWLLLLICALPCSAFAQGASGVGPSPVYFNEGNAPIPYNTAITTTSWTVVISSDIISRGLIIESDPANTVTICISTLTVSGIGGAANDACAATTTGVKLSPGGSWTDYSDNKWTARGYTATGAAALIQYLSGVRYRDKGDYGSIGASAQ